MRYEGKYSIGIDIGDASVGYAVIDCNGNVLKFKGRNMLGVRLFDMGSTAKTRRIFRNTRRRYSRRKERIKFLREIFNDEVMKVDENFFKRMDEGFLWLEDKSTGQKYTLFNDMHFRDSEYYGMYPTIYHLRQALCTSDKKEDIRLIYLALHHIIKYRGNFLSEGQKFDSGSNDIVEEFVNLKIELNERLGIDLAGTEETFKAIQEVLLNKTTAKKAKLERITDILVEEGNDKKYIKQLCSLMLGYNADLSVIFRKENLEKTSFSKVNMKKRKMQSWQSLRIMRIFWNVLKKYTAGIPYREFFREKPDCAMLWLINIISINMIYPYLKNYLESAVEKDMSKY